MSEPASGLPAIAAVILAAGKGTRMKSALHKVLHPIGGRPMLHHLLAELATLAPERQVVIVGDRADQIENALPATRITIAVQSPQLGTAHAVLQAEQALAGFEGVVLILFADVPLITAASMQRLVRAVADGAGIAVLGFRPAEPGAYGRIIADEKGQVLRMVEARDASPDELAVPLCNSGLMAVRASLLFPLLRQVNNHNAAGEYYLPDIVMLASGHAEQTIVLEAGADEVAGVNSRAELAAAELLFQTRARARAMASGVTLVAPETVWFAHDTDIAADTLVEPNVVFGPGVSIGTGAIIRAHSHIAGAAIGPDCEIGPFARLRPGTVLQAGVKIGNFVETKNSRLETGAKANHLSYLGDATIGPRANIGAGTITCNYDGFNKSPTTIGAEAFIGSNSALVAPVTVGDRAIVAAGTIVSRDVEPDALAIGRAPQQVKGGWASRFRALMVAKKSAKA